MEIYILRINRFKKVYFKIGIFSAKLSKLKKIKKIQLLKLKS